MASNKKQTAERRSAILTAAVDWISAMPPGPKKLAYEQNAHGSRRPFRRFGPETQHVSNLLQMDITKLGKELMERTQAAHEAAGVANESVPSTQDGGTYGEAAVDDLRDRLATNIIKHGMSTPS